MIHEGRMLLLDRPGRGEVRLPKGHVDAGETARKAALRETREESGYDDLQIVADLGEQLVEFEYEGDRYRRTERYYLMALGSEQRVPRDAHDTEQFYPIWVLLADAATRLTFEAEQRVARQGIELYRESKSELK